MLNITYRYLYNSPWGLFEGVPQKAKTLKHINNIYIALNYGWLEGIGIGIYCNNKPIKLLWKKEINK